MKNEKLKTKTENRTRVPAVPAAVVIFRFSLLAFSFSFAFSTFADDQISPQTQASIDRALKYLADHQQKDATWQTNLGPSTAVTSLGTMAFLARGHTPGQGPYGENVNRAIDFVVAHQMQNGLLSATNGTMYDHGVSTVMLCEA